ncbi:MAG: ATP-binding protein [Chlorobi bacterium]|nr:ATP-binding protein [Chlorobiota bacterium]
MRDVFKILIKDFVSKELPAINAREILLPLNSKKIISVIGARRVGKTYLLFGAIKRLREKYHKSRIVYINFEDDRLFPLSVGKLNDFIEGYYELYPENKRKTVWFFFDEVQNVERWELFIRRIYDNEKCKIFITGSSSKLLTKELAASLRGRTIAYEVFPYSFKEYLNLKNVSIDFYHSETRARIVNLFDKYLFSSAYPEVINATKFEKGKILSEYLNLLIYKDVVERYKIKNLFLIKYLLKFFVTNSASLLSVNKIYNDIKSQGISVSKDAIFQYLEYLQDSFVLFPVTIHSRNLREIQRNPRKIYLLDNGFIDAMEAGKNAGKRFENIAFLEFRRKGKEVSYFKKNGEVDFCVTENRRIELFNAAYSIADRATKEREIKSLLEGMKYFNIKESFLLTNNHEEKLTVDNYEINIMPLWKWLLGK